MSRASWYRAGKPETKPAKPPSMQQLAVEHHTSLRSLQRVRRVARAGQIIPEIGERMRAGESIHSLECFIKNCLKIADEHRTGVSRGPNGELLTIHLPDLS